VFSLPFPENGIIVPTLAADVNLISATLTIQDLAGVATGLHAEAAHSRDL